jgi:hypothetical protein
MPKKLSLHCPQSQLASAVFDVARSTLSFDRRMFSQTTDVSISKNGRRAFSEGAALYETAFQM